MGRVLFFYHDDSQNHQHEDPNRWADEEGDDAKNEEVLYASGS